MQSNLRGRKALPIVGLGKADNRRNHDCVNVYISTLADVKFVVARLSCTRADDPSLRGTTDYRAASKPPSTVTIWPLMKFEASDERNTAAPINSRGSPQRPAGVRAQM
jgi:hypothetical protein